MKFPCPRFLLGYTPTIQKGFLTLLPSGSLIVSKKIMAIQEAITNGPIQAEENGRPVGAGMAPSSSSACPSLPSSSPLSDSSHRPGQPTSNGTKGVASPADSHAPHNHRHLPPHDVGSTRLEHEVVVVSPISRQNCDAAGGGATTAAAVTAAGAEACALTVKPVKAAHQTAAVATSLDASAAAIEHTSNGIACEHTCGIGAAAGASNGGHTAATKNDKNEIYLQPEEVERPRPRRQAGTVAGGAGNKPAGQPSKARPAGGHSGKHRLIINLDDKNKFTDEVTV